MTAGTAQVRAALSSNTSKITTAQIEEALWHYYYDVDKSVAYLTSKYISPRTPAPAKTKTGGTSSSFHLNTFGTGVDESHLANLRYEFSRRHAQGAFKPLQK